MMYLRRQITYSMSLYTRLVQSGLSIQEEHITILQMSTNLQFFDMSLLNKSCRHGYSEGVGATFQHR